MSERVAIFDLRLPIADFWVPIAESFLLTARWL